MKKIQGLRIRGVLKRKNPYLFKALATEKASELVQRVLEAYISSSDEAIFGDAYFEQIARNLPDVMVSDAPGADLLRVEDKVVHAYSVKSGPNPFNSSQRSKQDTQFKELKGRLMKLQKQFDPVLAYSYGRRNKDSGANRVYREVSGEKFWTELTGDSDFYLKMIRLMKDIPAKKKDEYQLAWDAAVNKCTREFIEDFCFQDGRIDWEKLTKFVSATDCPELPKRNS